MRKVGIVMLALMACGGSGSKGSKSPDDEDKKPGPNAFDVMGASLQGAGQGFQRGFNSGGECTSKSDCYSGQFCLVPKGQSRGTCMEAK